jgi:hypothetical protein
MEVRNAWLAGVIGTGIATASATILPPPVGIALGALGVFIVLWGSDGYTRYALGGTVYALGFGATILTGVTPESYARTPAFALLGFGIVSALVILARVLLKKGAAKVGGMVVDDEQAETVAKATSSISGTLSMMWTVLTAQKQAAQISGVAGVGTLTFVLGVLGVEVPVQLPVPLWLLDNGINANVLLFVGSVVVTFHLVESVHSTWRAVKSATRTSSDSGVLSDVDLEGTATSVRDRVGSDDES